MTFATRFGFLAILLMAEALIVYSSDRLLGMALALAFALLASLRHKAATDALDLFDRSTLYFGLLAGLAIGWQVASNADHGLPVVSAVFSIPGLMAAGVFAASILVRARLIKTSKRKGYFG